MGSFEETLHSRTICPEISVYTNFLTSPNNALPRSQRIPFLKSFPRGLLLGLLDDGSVFRCILHDDKTPSAHIYQIPDGKYKGQWRYKCFGRCASERSISALDIVEELQDRGAYQAYHLLETLLGVGDSDWMAQACSELDLYEYYVTDGAMESRFPVLHTHLNQTNQLPVMSINIQQARRNLVDRTAEGRNDIISFLRLILVAFHLEYEYIRGIGGGEYEPS